MPVTDKIKQKLKEEAMKFIASDRGQKLMMNPQLMQGVFKVMELRQKLQQGLDLSALQKALNLVSREDLSKLGGTLDELRSKLDLVRKQTEELQSVLEKLRKG